jgi:hypothetical protein
MRQTKRLKNKYILVIPLFLFGFLVSAFPVNPAKVSAAACTAPTTDFGSVTSTVSIPATGSYRVWSRIQIPSTANNSFLLEIDGNTCYTVGKNASVPINTWTWVDYQNGTTTSKIDHTFTTTGNHTVKMIGTSDGVLLDRVIFTQDKTSANCNPPIGTGDDCANATDITNPQTGITAPTNGITVNGPSVAINASASDDSGTVSRVDFLINGTVRGSDTTSPYSYTWNTTNGTYPNGSYTLTTKAYDPSGRVGTSATVTVTVNNSTALNPGDTGATPGVVDFEDLLAVLNNWNATGKTRAQGDLKYNDGAVTFEDLLEVLNNWTK